MFDGHLSFTYHMVMSHPSIHLLHSMMYGTWERGGVCSLLPTPIVQGHIKGTTYRKTSLSQLTTTSQNESSNSSCTSQL